MPPPYHVTNPAMSLAASCIACVKLEHVLVLLQGMFSTLRCVRKAGNRDSPGSPSHLRMCEHTGMPQSSVDFSVCFTLRTEQTLV